MNSTVYFTIFPSYDDESLLLSECISAAHIVKCNRFCDLPDSVYPIVHPIHVICQCNYRVHVSHDLYPPSDIKDFRDARLYLTSQSLSLDDFNSFLFHFHLFVTKTF